jgi:uncharacterized damage-inducible protein DinB
MAQATLKGPVSLMARYNLWANQRFVEFFKMFSVEQLEREVGGSYPSIHKTLLHIWDAQDVWFKRLHEESPQQFRSNGLHGTTTEVFEGLIATSEEFNVLVSAMDDEQLEEMFSYVTFSGGPQASRRYEVLLHVFNHSMYHRGQCITIARIMGLEGVPGTDLIRFLRLDPDN